MVEEQSEKERKKSEGNAQVVTQGFQNCLLHSHLVNPFAERPISPSLRPPKDPFGHGPQAVDLPVEALLGLPSAGMPSSSYRMGKA